MAEDAVAEAPPPVVVPKAPPAPAPVAEALAPAGPEATAEAEAAPLIPDVAAEDAPTVVAPTIVIKKIMDDGHGGAHGGAWKIALATKMSSR